METTNHASGLGEAFASYQPTSMSPTQWDRFRDDAIELVLRLDHRDTEVARTCLSRLAVFLADQSAHRPEASLVDLLTPAQVEGYLESCLAAGDAPGTVQNRQGSLNALLAVRAGKPVPGRHRRRAESHYEPYTTGELQAVVADAAADGPAASLGLARTVLCGLAGRTLPSGDETVRVVVSGRVVTAGDFAWESPAGWALPASGVLDGASVEQGRAWGRKRLGFVLDRRRLVLTYITRVVETLPALVAVQLPGVGRDRLTAAVRAASRPCPGGSRRASPGGRPHVRADGGTSVMASIAGTARAGTGLGVPTEEIPMASRRPSKAEIRRRMEAQKTETPVPPLPPEIAEKVERYTPRDLDPVRWQQVRPFVLDVLARYEPTTLPSASQRLTALTAFAAWAFALGYDLDRATLLTNGRIEAFVASADLGKTAATNYRSRLRGIAKKLNQARAGGAASVSVPHRAVQPPYTAVEAADIAYIARTQPSDVIRQQMCACVGLGLGAGLDSVDIKPLCGRHVTDHGEDGIKVDVPGRRPRTVWVRVEYEELVRIGIEGVGADRLVIGHSPDRRNVAGKVFENAHILGSAPHFEQSRMRTTWLAALLLDRVPLPVVMDAAGLSSARTLTDLVPMLDVEVDVAAELRGRAR